MGVLCFESRSPHSATNARTKQGEVRLTLERGEESGFQGCGVGTGVRLDLLKVSLTPLSRSADLSRQEVKATVYSALFSAVRTEAEDD